MNKEELVEMINSHTDCFGLITISAEELSEEILQIYKKHKTKSL